MNLIAAERRFTRRPSAQASTGLWEIHQLISKPGVISLALGMPATDLLPAALFDGFKISRQALQYGRDFAPLQEQIVELMRLRGVACRREQILLCNGSQQALHLLGRLLISPGDRVIVEDLTYEGCLSAIRTAAPAIATVPITHRGPDLDALENRLADDVPTSFIYTVPEGHNPLGISFSPETRRRLLDIVRRFDVPLIEDDAYGLLSLDDHAEPAMRALDEDHVLYVGSLSKVLAPSLRLGWIVVPEHLAPSLSQLVHTMNLHVVSLGWHAAEQMLAASELPRRLDLIREEYRRRRDVMIDALRRFFPAGTCWTQPRSGLYVWVDLPPDREFDTVSLLRRSVDHGVAFCPGPVFAAREDFDASNSLRLCFGNASPEDIVRGVETLGRLLHDSPPSSSETPS